jgi:hypothetical protein
MSTERSDKVHSQWRDSAEKFDYFILGITCALCAFISQTYKPERVGLNAGTLELLALLILVLAVVAGFRRIERTLLATAINHRVLHAYEARGGIVAKLPEGRTLLNEATGEVFPPGAAVRRVAELTKSIQHFEAQLGPVQEAAQVKYHLRNALTLVGFLCLLGARVWSAYP